MRYSGEQELVVRQRPITGHEARDQGARLAGRDGASMRMLAAMAPMRSSGLGQYRSPDDRRDLLTPFAEADGESDAEYFRRRSSEERRAADEAGGREARAAHRELALRYVRLSEQLAQPRGFAPQHRLSVGRARLADMLSQRFGRTSRGVGQELSAPPASIAFDSRKGLKHQERTEHETRI